MFVAALLTIPSDLLITPFRGGSKREQKIMILALYSCVSGKVSVALINWEHRREKNI